MQDEVHMRLWLVPVATAFSLLMSGAQAQDLRAAGRSEPIRAFSRLASQGIGYSVLYQAPGTPAGPYRVKVVCTIGQVSATALCPTANYDSFCPTAQIVCR